MQWDRADLSGYEARLSTSLSSINLQMEALNCNGSCNNDCCNVLESYYMSLCSCMHLAAKATVPKVKVGFQKHWWTPELDELKQQCIDATDLWKAAGRPRSGDVNVIRVRTKLKYKSAIKEATYNADTVLMMLCMINYVEKTQLGFGKLGENTSV